MKASDSDTSIFNIGGVISRFYNAFYCSREKPQPTDIAIHDVEEPSRNQESPAATAEAGELEGQGHHNQNRTLERLKSEWFEAVNDQKLDKVQELMKNGAVLEYKDETGWSALHVAAWNNYTEICQLLLTSAEVDINTPGPGGSSSLSLAAQRGNVNIIKMLLAANCDLKQTADLVDNHGVTALHLAAQYGHTEVVRMLVDAGAVVNCAMTVRGINGVTPLHLAVQNEHLDIMDILIEAGCDVHSSTQSQSTDGATEASVMESVC